MQKLVLVPYEQFKRMSNPISANDEGKEEPNADQNSIVTAREESPEHRLGMEDILEAFPPRMKARARILLGYLNRSDRNLLDWSGNGEIISSGVNHPGSHIVDLIYNSMCPGRKYQPVCSDMLYEALKQANVPPGLIRNKTAQFIGKSKGKGYKEKSKPAKGITWKSY